MDIKREIALRCMLLPCVSDMLGKEGGKQRPEGGKQEAEEVDRSRARNGSAENRALVHGTLSRLQGLGGALASRHVTGSGVRRCVKQRQIPLNPAVPTPQSCLIV
jgi:hypothetical protein